MNLFPPPRPEGAFPVPAAAETERRPPPLPQFWLAKKETVGSWPPSNALRGAPAQLRPPRLDALWNHQHQRRQEQPLPGPAQGGRGAKKDPVLCSVSLYACSPSPASACVCGGDGGSTIHDSRGGSGAPGRAWLWLTSRQTEEQQPLGTVQEQQQQVPRAARRAGGQQRDESPASESATSPPSSGPGQ